jgi:hypothetical protein
MKDNLIPLRFNDLFDSAATETRYGERLIRHRRKDSTSSAADSAWPLT